MSTDPQKLFRNYDEMEAIYQQRHANGLTGKPYIVKTQRRDQLLTFFGSRHTNDVNDPQNNLIEVEWQLFIDGHNKNKLAICEGGLRPYETSRDHAIQKYSEPGLLTWLAKKDSIKLVSPEPDETDEINDLLSQHFKVGEIITYYFGRQMMQWLKADHKNHPDWKKYIGRYMNFYAELEPLHNEDLSLPSILKMYQQSTGKTFNEKDEKSLYEISAPTSNAVSAASGVYRDASLFNAISEAWADGLDTFALYGSGHAIVLEPALNSLVSNNYDNPQT